VQWVSTSQVIYISRETTVTNARPTVILSSCTLYNLAFVFYQWCDDRKITGTTPLQRCHHTLTVFLFEECRDAPKRRKGMACVIEARIVLFPVIVSLGFPSPLMTRLSGDGIVRAQSAVTRLSAGSYCELRVYSMPLRSSLKSRLLDACSQSTMARTQLPGSSGFLPGLQGPVQLVDHSRGSMGRNFVAYSRKGGCSGLSFYFRHTNTRRGFIVGKSARVWENNNRTAAHRRRNTRHAATLPRCHAASLFLRACLLLRHPFSTHPSSLHIRCREAITAAWHTYQPSTLECLFPSLIGYCLVKMKWDKRCTHPFSVDSRGMLPSTQGRACVVD
jgi:hypothetical protein